MDFITLAQQCAPSVHPHTMQAVSHVESSFNPYAIGVVGGKLKRQPQSKAEAMATVKSLEQAGFNFSLGVAQVNRYNLPKYGLDYEKAFDPCESLRAGSAILTECFERAKVRVKDEQQALRAALSCYYSGNFATGFKSEGDKPSYVQKVLGAAAGGTVAIVPPIAVIPTRGQAKVTTGMAAAPTVVQLTTEGENPATRSVNAYADTERRVMVFR